MATPTTRRDFVAKASASFAAFNIVPANVLGGQHTAPSELMGTATIGTGGRGMGFVKNDERRPTFAVCDIDATRAERARQKAGPLCKAYSDFREILERDDIDQVFIATPPHWHAVMSIMAAKAGKDVMCEKPLARTIGEGRAVVNAIRRYGCDFRYGAYCTGTPAELAAKAYHSGLLGRPLTVYQAGALGCPFKVRQWTGLVDAKPQPIPEHLDWDMYCCPSPLRPFQPHRHGGSHRGYWDYDGGGVSDMGGHILNCIVGAIGKGHTSPVAIETDAPPADEQAVGIWYTGKLSYADGTTIVLDSSIKPDATPASREGLYLEGPEGKLFLDRDNRARTQPAGLLAALNAYELPYSVPATTNLRDPVEIVTHAHHAIAVVHLLNISIRMGRPIQFDPVNEVVVGDEQANALINQPMRAPWHI
jgi:myo-inositol 2-dehydrogenase/D-chiro-inositol 1-dehydrogenase